MDSSESHKPLIKISFPWDESVYPSEIEDCIPARRFPKWLHRHFAITHGPDFEESYIEALQDMNPIAEILDGLYEDYGEDYMNALINQWGSRLLQLDPVCGCGQTLTWPLISLVSEYSIPDSWNCPSCGASLELPTKLALASTPVPAACPDPAAATAPEEGVEASIATTPHDGPLKAAPQPAEAVLAAPPTPTTAELIRDLVQNFLAATESDEVRITAMGLPSRPAVQVTIWDDDPTGTATTVLAQFLWEPPPGHTTRVLRASVLAVEALRPGKTVLRHTDDTGRRMHDCPKKGSLFAARFRMVRSELEDLKQLFKGMPKPDHVNVRISVF